MLLKGTLADGGEQHICSSWCILCVSAFKVSARLFSEMLVVVAQPVSGLSGLERFGDD